MGLSYKDVRALEEKLTPVVRNSLRRFLDTGIEPSEFEMKSLHILNSLTFQDEGGVKELLVNTCEHGNLFSVCKHSDHQYDGY